MLAKASSTHSASGDRYEYFMNSLCNFYFLACAMEMGINRAGLGSGDRECIRGEA
jgi:hypothetical protein